MDNTAKELLIVLIDGLTSKKSGKQIYDCSYMSEKAILTLKNFIQNY